MEFVNHPYVSPGNRRDLSDLPPILLQASTDECLYDEIMEFHDRLKATSENHQLQLFPNMPHVFYLLGSLGGFGNQAILQASRFILEHTSSTK